MKVNIRTIKTIKVGERSEIKVMKGVIWKIVGLFDLLFIMLAKFTDLNNWPRTSRLTNQGYVIHLEVRNNEKSY